MYKSVNLYLITKEKKYIKKIEVALKVNQRSYKKDHQLLKDIQDTKEMLFLVQN